MARRRQRSGEEETTYWLSYSDMMAALLLVFVLIISFTMLQSKQQYEEKERQLQKQELLIEEQKEQMGIQQEQLKGQQEQLAKQQGQMDLQQEQLDKIVGVRGDLIAALRDEFEGSDLRVSVDSQTGAITFDSSVLFDTDKSDIKATGAGFLNEFLPRYFNVLLDGGFKEFVSEIIIEGHTDTSASYLYNLELSQRRALSVVKYCLDGKNGSFSGEKAKEVQTIITANGRSFSDPIYNEDGTVNMDASRRVEFKFRLKDEEMVQEMMKILEEKVSTVE